MKNETWAILIASGRDAEIGTSVTSPFLFLNDRPVIAYALAAAEQAPEISGVIVVIDRENASDMATLMKTYRFAKIKKVVGGAARRPTSMCAGLSYVDPGVEYICVLDPNRPLVTPGLVSDVVKAAWRGGIATAAEPVNDPILVIKKNAFKKRLPEPDGHYWTLLTPQAFPRQLLVDAYATTRKTAADDLEAVTAIAPGSIPRIVAAPPACHVSVCIRNIDDLATATAFLRDPNRI